MKYYTKADIPIDKKYLTTKDVYISKIENMSLFYDKFFYIVDEKKHKNKKGKIDKKKVEKEAVEHYKYLQKYINTQDVTKKVKDTIIRQLESTIGTENYRLIVGKLKSNMAVNLAAGVPENTGISLDRITSTPYIYGSAVKGCSKHASWHAKGSLDDLDIEVFGPNKKSNSDDSDSSKGGISFLQGFFIGGTLGIDILTPHTTGTPIPSKYPIVKMGSKFAFILVLNSNGKRCKKYTPSQLLDRAEESLLKAFELGIGAKTSSGLGWFERDEKEESAIQYQIQKKIDDEKKKAAE